MKITIDIPDEIYREAEAVALKRGVSVEQLFGAMADSHLQSWRALKAKAAKGNLDEYRDVMNQVPDVEPEKYDRL
jgi:hypothetical protein